MEELTSIYLSTYYYLTKFHSLYVSYRWRKTMEIYEELVKMGYAKVIYNQPDFGKCYQAIIK